MERFKTGYAVVRNSTRYLPLAAANVTRQAQDSGEEALARSVAVLVQDMNLFLASPNADRARAAWPRNWSVLREASVVASTGAFQRAGQPGRCPRGGAAGAGRDRPRRCSQRATSSDIAVLDGASWWGQFRVRARQAGACKVVWYERGILGVHRGCSRCSGWDWPCSSACGGARTRSQGRAPKLWRPCSAGARRPTRSDDAFGGAPRARRQSAGDEDEEDLRATVLAATEGDSGRARRGEVTLDVGLPLGALGLRSPPMTTWRAVLRHGFVARCVADGLTASARRSATRMDYLHQTQDTYPEQTLHDHDALLPALDRRHRPRRGDRGRRRHRRRRCAGR